MSYTIISDKEYDEDVNESSSDISGFTPRNGSISGEDEQYLIEGVNKLRDLVESGYISDGEEQRRKELIEQFFEYQIDLRDDADEEITYFRYYAGFFCNCWNRILTRIRFR
jgi:hypothetical protein